MRACLRAILGLLVFSFGVLYAFTGVHAQQLLPESWAPTQIIAGQDVPAMWPMVAADPWGRIHVFWTQPLESEDSGIYAIVHRMKDADGWHDPVDIMLRDPWPYSHPDIVINSDWAYMIWAEWNGLYISRAPAQDLGKAQNWEPKLIVSADTGIEHSRLALASDGSLHVVYGRLASNLSGDGSTYYLSSQDRGTTWTLPLKISPPVDASVAAHMRPRLAIDSDDNIHVVWVEHIAPQWLGDNVYYAHLLKGTAEWSEPVLLSQPRPDGVGTWWQAAPNIVTDRDDAVHLVWTCGEKTFRCYRYSTDRGVTWSSTVRIFEGYESLAGWDDLTIDLEGTLHLVAQLRMPENVYHAQKRSGFSWGPPVPMLSLEEAYQSHFPRIAISAGNQLHVVMQPDGAGPIYYAEGRSDSSEQTPEPVPTATPYLTPPKSTVPPPLYTPAPSAKVPSTAAGGPAVDDTLSQASGVAPLVIGLLPALLLVIGVLVWQIGARRR